MTTARQNLNMVYCRFYGVSLSFQMCFDHCTVAMWGNVHVREEYTEVFRGEGDSSVQFIVRWFRKVCGVGKNKANGAKCSWNPGDKMGIQCFCKSEFVKINRWKYYVITPKGVTIASSTSCSQWSFSYLKLEAQLKHARVGLTNSPHISFLPASVVPPSNTLDSFGIGLLPAYLGCNWVWMMCRHRVKQRFPSFLGLGPFETLIKNVNHICRKMYV